MWRPCRHGDPIIPAEIKRSTRKFPFWEFCVTQKFDFREKQNCLFGLCNVALMPNKEIPAGVIKFAKIMGVTNNM